MRANFRKGKTKPRDQFRTRFMDLVFDHITDGAIKPKNQCERCRECIYNAIQSTLIELERETSGEDGKKQLSLILNGKLRDKGYRRVIDLC